MALRTINVISSIATRQVLADLVALYRTAQPDTTVNVESVGGVDAARRVAAGEAFDIVALARDALDTLEGEGRLVAGSTIDVVRSGVAIAVRSGTSHLDISSGNAVRRAVLASRTLGYSTGPSGVQLARLFEHWGIAAELKSRIVAASPGVPVGSLVATGEVELGFQQLSELLNLPGIDIVGPLPDDIQIVTTFSAGLAATSVQPEAARAFLAFLVSPQTAAVKRRNGMDAA